MNEQDQFTFEVAERAAIIAEKEGEYTEEEIEAMAHDFTVEAWANEGK
jgi:hypothetical protein